MSGRAGALALAIANLAVIPPAWAQDDTVPSPLSDSSAGLQDIVVTARRREESLQDTPISISAVSANELAARGVNGIEEIAPAVPNLVIQNNPGNGASTSAPAVYIRGIGQDDFAPTLEPGVGIYIDGVYLARSVGALLDLVDVERIEVLRGPQGTLFGRNTIGGAISVTTRKPDRDLSAQGEVTYGTDDRLNIKAGVNFALTDTLFGRVSAASFNQDGYVPRVAGGKKLGNDNTLTFRGALRWTPSDVIEFNLAFDHTRDRESGAPYVVSDIQFANTGSFIALNNFIARGDPVSCFTPEQRDNRACYNQRFVSRTRNFGTADQYSNLDVWGISLTGEVSLGAVRVKSITAYRDLDSRFSRDADNSDLRIAHLFDDLKQDQFSQEIQLLGSAFHDRLEFLTGLYYFKEDGVNVNLLEFVPANFRSGGAFETESWAVFSQATLSLGSGLSVTAGGRYTREKKRFTPDQVITAVNVPPFIFPFPVGTPILPNTSSRISLGEWTPLLTLSWKPSAATLLYATFSEGFKSGGFTQRVFPPEPTIPTFAPEFVSVYELGFKISAFDRRVSLNSAVFHTKYDDLQVLTANLTRVGPFIANAAKAEITGGEIELSAAPGGGVRLQLGAGYLDPKYQQIEDAALEINPRNRFRRISKWTLNGSISKVTELGAIRLTPRIDWSYRSSFFNDAPNTPQLKTEGFHLVNTSVAVDLPKTHVTMIAGVKNLFDNKFVANGFLQPNFGLIESIYDRGRQWYLTGRVRF